MTVLLTVLVEFGRALLARLQEGETLTAAQVRDAAHAGAAATVAAFPAHDAAADAALDARFGGEPTITHGSKP